MIASLFSLISSIVALARIITEPLPVVYAFTMPERPKIVAPVGKSGPGIISISSSLVMFGFSI